MLKIDACQVDMGTITTLPQFRTYNFLPFKVEKDIEVKNKTLGLLNLDKIALINANYQI